MKENYIVRIKPELTRVSSFVTSLDPEYVDSVLKLTVESGKSRQHLKTVLQCAACTASKVILEPVSSALRSLKINLGSRIIGRLLLHTSLGAQPQ